LTGIQRWANAAKGKTLDTLAEDLSLVVKATTLQWLEKENGTTDANKF